jgi:hypothetical protein
MKKIIFCIIATFLSLTFIPVQAKDTVKPDKSVTVPKPIDAKEAKALEVRLNEINSMDKTKLNASEKKSLRKEVKATKQRLHDGGYVYVSAGTLLLVIILLIILL